MEEETRKHIENLEGRCLALTVAMATLIVRVGATKPEMLDLVKGVSSNIASTRPMPVAKGSPRDLGMMDVDTLLRRLILAHDPKERSPE